MADCKKCGKCCEVIVLKFDKEHIDECAKSYKFYISKDSNKFNENGNNFYFASRNFVSISEECAYKINPFLKKWSRGKNYYYQCKRWDNVSKMCSIYSLRPEVCSGFPWYGGTPTKRIQPLYSPECSFQADMNKWPTNKVIGLLNFL